MQETAVADPACVIDSARNSGNGFFESIKNSSVDRLWELFAPYAEYR